MFFSENRERIEAACGGGRVLDVGGWADPFPRADYVLDLFSYETRSLTYHGIDRLPDSVLYPGPRPGERFRKETWVVHDICSSRPFPFPDKFFDFVICSHTLEDLRDPVRVCEELVRVGRAGYLETPSRIVEQTVGPSGAVGASHHRWMVEMSARGVTFTMKPPHLHLTPEACIPLPYTHRLPEREKYAWLFWQDEFEFSERLVPDPVADAMAFARGLDIPALAWWRLAYRRLGYRLRHLLARRKTRPEASQRDGGLWTWPKLVAAASPNHPDIRMTLASREIPQPPDARPKANRDAH